MKRIVFLAIMVSFFNLFSRGQALVNELAELTYFTTENCVYMPFADAQSQTTGVDDYNCFAYFPETVIAEHTGESILTIAFNISNTSEDIINSIKVCVWTDTSNAGTNPAYTQVVEDFVNGWNEITLTTPYELGTEAVFIGYTLNGMGYCVGIEEGVMTTEPNGYGNMIQHSNGFVQRTGSAYTPFGDIAIKATVGTLENLEAELLSIETDSHHTAGMVDIKGRVRNLGITPITSFDVTYALGDETSEVYSVSDVNITTGLDYVFTHNAQADLSTVGAYQLTVTISNINGGDNDANLDNNSLSKTIYSVEEWIKRKNLFELFQAPTNYESAAANNILDDLFYNQNEELATLIKYPMDSPDAGDPYYIEEAGVRKDFYGDILSVPALKINGETHISLIDISVDELNDDVSGAFFKISGNYKLVDSVFNLDVTIKPLYPVEGEVALYAAVLEKETTGNTGSNEQTVFHNIAMKLADNGQGHILSNIVSGQNQSVLLSMDMQSTYVEEMSDTRILVWLQNTATKEVYQSAYIDDIALVKEYNSDAFELYPNPAKSDCYLNKVAQSQVTIYNMLGQLVYSQYCNDNHLRVDLSRFEKGTYIVKVNKDKQIYTKKMVVNN